MKIKNTSNIIKNFKQEGEWISVNPGDTAELPKCVLTNETDVQYDIDKHDVKETPEKVMEEPKRIIIPRFSKSALKRFDEESLLDLLKKHGVANTIIKTLKTEAKRVKYILELQDEE